VSAAHSRILVQRRFQHQWERVQTPLGAFAFCRFCGFRRGSVPLWCDVRCAPYGIRTVHHYISGALIPSHLDEGDEYALDVLAGGAQRRREKVT
jgi:hypothetical protein